MQLLSAHRMDLSIWMMPQRFLEQSFVIWMYMNFWIRHSRFHARRIIRKPGIRGLNPTPEEMDEIGNQADTLIAGATECTMSKEDLVHTLRFLQDDAKDAGAL